MTVLAKALRLALKRVAADKQNIHGLASTAEQSLEKIASRPSTLAIGFFAGFWLGKNYPRTQLVGSTYQTQHHPYSDSSSLAYRLINKFATPIVLAALSRYLQDTTSQSSKHPAA